MRELTLFFVGFYKHGDIQGLFDGPFLDYTKAREALDLREVGFRIVRVAIPITEYEVLN